MPFIFYTLLTVVGLVLLDDEPTPEKNRSKKSVDAEKTGSKKTKSGKSETETDEE